MQLQLDYSVLLWVSTLPSIPITEYQCYFLKLVPTSYWITVGAISTDVVITTFIK